MCALRDANCQLLVNISPAGCGFGGVCSGELASLTVGLFCYYTRSLLTRRRARVLISLPNSRSLLPLYWVTFDTEEGVCSGEPPLKCQS
jgi:hypothetical protein